MPRPLIPDRRERIIVAARELLLERGWARTSIADIASRTGIGKGAVYLEFAGKPALLDAVLRRSLRDLTQRVRRRVLDVDEPVDLAAIYTFAIEALLDDPLMTAMYLGERSPLGQHMRDVEGDRYQERFAWLGEYAERLQRAGVIGAEVQAGVLTRTLSVFTVGLVSSSGALEPMSREELRAVVGLFADLVADGVRGDGEIDTAAAREAQLHLLAQLDEQLEGLEHPT